jgi:uncharacterized protein YjbI with pentapeptide repeats
LEQHAMALLITTSGADLEGVNLMGANLNKANLIGANLAQARFDIRTTTPWG